MEEFRAFHIFQLSENTYQFGYVVAIERTEVTDVHAFKHILLVGQCRLQGIVQAQQSFPTFVVQQSLSVQPL